MHHVRTTVAPDQRLRWSTTLALVAVQKLMNGSPLNLPEREALSRLAEDFRSVSRKAENLHGDVLLMRRMSGSRVSGNLQRLLAMNSPKMSMLEPETFEQAAAIVDSVIAADFQGTASLQHVRSACEQLLRAI